MEIVKCFVDVDDNIYSGHNYSTLLLS